MIEERFTADILADIKNFQKKIKEVDKTIRKMAMGVTIPVRVDTSDFNRGINEYNSMIQHMADDANVNITGDITNLQQSIAQANTELLAINNNSSVDINGNISDFTQAANDVNRQTDNLSRRITEARIGADIGSFERRMVDVQRALTDAGDTVTPEITADISGFMAEIATVQDRMRALARAEADPQIEADIAGFMAQMAVVQSELVDLTERHDVNLDADTGGFFRGAARVQARIREFARERVAVRILASWNNYQNTMGQIANFSRAIGEVGAMVGRGGLMVIAPAAIPVIASAVGLIGNLGPMLATAAGSTFALGSAFATAGIGAGAFGAIAVTNLKDIFGASSDLKDLNEKLAKADTWKEQLKIQNEIKRVQGSLNAEQTKGLKAMDALKSTWSGIAGALETQTIQIFTGAMKILSGVLTDLKPLFTTVVDAAKNLTDSLGTAVNAKPMQDFFNYLNTSAAPMLETITKAAGNFIQGFLSMMTAFGPLATETSSSFLKMSEGFAAWAAKLSENKSFQSFVSYVSENMPKIRSIFGDAIEGIVNLFAGFSGSSSDMMTSLQDMMERFKEWSSTISENKGFQNFIDYIKTNGPVVVSTIGQIVKFVVNMGTALAPLGQKMLEIIDAVVKWSNSMLEAHPWLGKLAAGALLVVGGLKALAPPILLARALFGGLITSMIKAVAKMAWTATTMVAKWLWMAAKAAFHAARIAASWTITTGTSMVVALAKMTASAAVFVAKWVLIGARALLHAAKVAAAWALSTGAAMVTAVAKMIATAAVFVARWVFMGAQALIQAARMAAAWFIALGPIGWVTAGIIALAVLIIANWDKIVAWTKKAWTATWNWIKETWEKVSSKTAEITSKVWNMVKDKFSSIVSGVKEKMSQVQKWVQDKWSEAKSKALSILTDIVSGVVSKFVSIVSNVRDKMNAAKNWVQDKWEEAKSAASRKLGELVESVSTFFSKTVTKVRTKLGEAVEAVGEFIGKMPGKVLEFVGDMVSAGADLVSGVISGIKSKISEGLGVIGGLATSLISRFKRDTDTHSPSRAFADIAKYFAPGIVRGINQTKHLAINSISELASGLTSAFNPDLSMQMAHVSMNPIDTDAQMGILRRQIKQELSVDMSVNHRGNEGSGTGGGNQTIVFNQPIKSPYEQAQQVKRAQQELSWGV